MSKVSLEAAQDHVETLAHEGDPVRAVLELIWNGLDADAHHVSVDFERNEADGIVGVRVVDDGHGIAPEALESAFRWIGGSWKKLARRSQREGRPLHGKSGQGRLRAFALGSQVRWETVTDDTAGVRVRSVVTSNATSRSEFDLSEPLPVESGEGTAFEATGRQGLDRLDADASRVRIVSALAPYLIAHADVEVVYDGTRVQPAENIERDTTLDLSWTHEGQEHTAALRIIEWREAAGRAIHLCDDNGVPIDDLDSAPAADFRYSAYVMWADMPQHRNEWLLAALDGGESVVGGLVAAARARIEDHFEDRRAELRRELVTAWKDARTYPYSEEPASDEEELEQATFDVVATSISRHIPKAKKQQRLVLGLLRESLQQRPADVTQLLDQFLGLPQDERDQLDRLLTNSGLSNIIRATTSVTNRLEFLRALELMVFDPEAAGMVGERKHLHRILENELWVFGEEYNLMASELGLTAVLERHLNLLDEENADRTPVRRLDGTVGRLDLLLSAATTEHDRNRHLVVELKAPRVVATAKELQQIKSYAKAVAADARFASTRTVWDFWLVTATMDDDVRGDATQRDRPPGLAYEPTTGLEPGATVRVWVKTWSELIEDGRRRLEYFRSNLQHNPSMEDARLYLATHHGSVVPEGLVEDLRRVDEAGSTPA